MEQMQKYVIDGETGEGQYVPLTPQEIEELERIRNNPYVPSLEEQRQERAFAYRNESDPLFFKFQRGEATLEEWKEKVNEIKQRFPYSKE